MIQKRVLGTALAVVALFLGACLPKTVVWSPDGSQALVLGGDGVRVSDGEGKLSQVVGKDIGVAAWFPDGKRVVLAVKEEAKTWDDLRRGLSDAEAKEVMDNAAIIREEALKYTGEWDKFAEAMGPKVKWTLVGNGWGYAGMYLRDKDAAGLPEKVGEMWKVVEGARADVFAIEVADFAEGAVKPGVVLCRTAHDVIDMRVGPEGKFVLLSLHMDLPSNNDTERALTRVWVADAAGKLPLQEVTARAAGYPDWTADGLSVVYARMAVTEPEKDAVVGGWMVRKRVIGEDGQWATGSHEEVLARLAFDPYVCVRTMGDGRILFTGPEVHLPAAAGDNGARNIFVFNGGGQPAVQALVVREAHAEMIDAVFIEVSPDGKEAALTDLNDHVVVLDLGTGDLKVVQSRDIPDKARMAPVWRNNDELCLLVPPEKGGHLAEVGLYSVSKGTKRVLSGDWPEAVTRGFLTEAPEANAESQPAR